MKVTVEIDEKNLMDIMHYTGEKRKGRAIATIANEALMFKRRKELCEKVIAGKIRINFPDRHENANDRSELWKR